ncbi:MAG: MBL fold metallo-hydrolase [Clostridia bacterium]|nr:MBL fold metallo-hydrolase [Clostridia bacterium]
MDIQRIMVGELQVNCYLLTDNGEAAVIDPGANADLILEKIEESGASLTKILLTHGHFDHTGAVKILAEKTGAKVYIHSGDKMMLLDNNCNLSFLTGEKIELYTPDVLLDEIQEIPLGSTNIKVYHTPGHSTGGVTYQWGNTLFCGDLLFKNSIGRFDFGDLKTELESIKFLINSFPEETMVLPGHGVKTTIGDEKKYNPYLD